MAERVSVQHNVDAPIERVWQAWTTADELQQWFSASGDKLQILAFDLQPGGKVRLKSPGSAGEYTWTYITIDKPRELVFDILDFSFAEYPDGIGGVCHVEFVAIGSKTQITVWGELPDPLRRNEYQAMHNGWLSTLQRLNEYVKKEA